MKKKYYKVAVFVEASRGYGRALCEGIAEFAQAHKYWSFTGGGEGWAQRLTNQDIAVDGVIARIPDARAAKALSRLGVPVVDIYRWADYPNIATVDADHSLIGRMAANWFVERRFRNFAFCGYHKAPFSEARSEAYVDTLSNLGFPCQIYDTDIYPATNLGRMILQAESYDTPPDSAELAFWLKQLPRPTALLCCHDKRAYQVITLCKELGIKVPFEIAVMGVDNDLLLCGFSDPMLSSIDPHAQRIGWLGARCLADLMEGKSMVMQHTRVPPRKIVDRASTETDPVDPPWLAESLNFIRQEIPNGINATDVINFLNRSHTSVESTFKQVLGHTVHQEITRLRSNEACRLLIETTLSVSDISTRCGFSSPQYFNRFFQQNFNQTPQQYRVLEQSRLL